MRSDETQDAFGSFGARFDPAKVTAIGPYRDVRYFAEGGMAWVYEARHPDFPEKRLAVKLMKPEFALIPMMRERFLQEAKLLAEIGHPNLVTIHTYAVDEASRCPYFAMDYIDGGTLAEKLEADGPLSVEKAGELYDRVLGALAALHERRVVHRDIKPLNIFLWRSSGEPMLADLGIARDTGASGAATTHQYIGSPLYSSPEQVAGMRVDVRSDIFSLGISLFQTLAGYHPYEDEKNVDTSNAISVIGLLSSLFRDNKPILLEFPREIPKAVRAVIRKACEIQPDKRFANAAEMRRALRRAVRASEGRGDSAVARQVAAAIGWLQTNGLRLSLGAGALAALAALAAGGYGAWGYIQRARANAAVESARQTAAALAPDDPALAKRVRAAGEQIARDPGAAIVQAEAVCTDLAQRIATSLEQGISDSTAALRREKFAVQHAGIGEAAWEQLDALTRDESGRALRSGGEAACAAPARLEKYRRSLADGARALEAELATPDFKSRVAALRDRAHGAELAASIDEKLLAEADGKFAAGDLPEAFELYTHAELGARAAGLSQRYAPRLRDVAAAPEFAERRSQVTAALARIVKLGPLSDLDALATAVDLAAKEANSALEAVRDDVRAALAAGEQALERARQGGVSHEGLARGEAELARARSDLESERFAAALIAARETEAELGRILGGVGPAKAAEATVSAKRDAAVAAGAEVRALAKGDALRDKARKLLEEGDPAKAADVFASADSEYEAVRTAALEIAAKPATLDRDRAISEKKRASELGASAADLGRGDEAYRLGEQAFAAGDLNPAQQHFSAARDAYERAPLRAAEERVEQARSAALDAGADTRALAAGDASRTAARAAEQPSDRLRLFGAAETAFGRARTEAVAAADRDKASALRAQSEAQAARRKARDANVPAADLADADKELELGDAELQGARYPKASQHYALATKAYQRPPKGGEVLEQARRKGKLAESARAGAVRAQATEPDLRAGLAALDEGKVALAKGDAATASERFETARRLFDEAEKGARKESAALEKALGAQRAARKAREVAAAKGADAAALGAGNAALSRGDAQLAARSYAAAAETYTGAEAEFRAYKPPPPVTPPPGLDAQAIAQSALGRYAAAYESRDIDRLAAAWRMTETQRDRTEAAFKQVSQAKVDIGALAPRLEGDHVVVDFDQRIQLGSHDSGLVRMRAVLKQSGGSWVIVELGKGQ